MQVRSLSIALSLLLGALIHPSAAQGGAATGDNGVKVSSDPVTPAVYSASMSSGLNLSSIPQIAVKPVGSGTCNNTQCAPGDCEKCWESCGNCAKPDDIYGCPTKGDWALSFDDGPGQYTGEILDTLKKLNVTASFFVMGGHVAKYADFVKRAVSEGHMVGSHTWSHPHLMSLTNEQIIAELKMTDDAIANATGFRPKYIRPPYGEADDRVKAIFQAFGYKSVLWNMDTTDYAILTAKQDKTKIYQAFVDANTKGTDLNAKNDPGFISLQHDVYEDSINQEETIINYLRQQKFRLVPVSTCINDPTPYYDPKTNKPVSATGASTPATPNKDASVTTNGQQGAISGATSSMVGSSAAGVLMASTVLLISYIMC